MMDAATARARIDFADMVAEEAHKIAREAIERSAAEMKRAAIEQCAIPRPGSLVKNIRTGRIFRVVERQGYGRCLDGLDDSGVGPKVMDWTRFDVIQGSTEKLDAAELFLKQEGDAFAEMSLDMPVVREAAQLQPALERRMKARARRAKAKKRKGARK